MICSCLTNPKAGHRQVSSGTMPLDTACPRKVRASASATGRRRLRGRMEHSTSQAALRQWCATLRKPRSSFPRHIPRWPAHRHAIVRPPLRRRDRRQACFGAGRPIRSQGAPLGSVGSSCGLRSWPKISHCTRLPWHGTVFNKVSEKLQCVLLHFLLSANGQQQALDHLAWDSAWRWPPKSARRPGFASNHQPSGLSQAGTTAGI
jgi:hypothetical protein